MSENQAEKPRRTFSSLKPRVITGLALAGGALALVLLAPLHYIALAAAAAAGIGMWEYTRMCVGRAFSPAALLSFALAAAVTASAMVGPAGVAAALGLSLALCAAADLCSSGEPAERMGRLQGRAWGVLYQGGLFASLILILFMPQGRMLILFLLTVVVAADTGAYFTGHALGRHKMAPRLSPGKTMEGLAGGLLLAAGAGAVFAFFLMPDTGARAGAILGAVLALFSVLGDLLESVIKRSAGVKDSSGLLPGHGGLMDRVDGIIMAGPPLLMARVLWWL